MTQYNAIPQIAYKVRRISIIIMYFPLFTVKGEKGNFNQYEES